MTFLVFTIALIPFAIASSALAQYNIPNASVLQQQQNPSQLRMIQDRYYQQQQIKRMEQKRAQEKEEEKDEVFE
tara:strand:- start:313 stop:534 length:222 start_codon:yes stop_codon:yes gene_type:complete